MGDERPARRPALPRPPPSPASGWRPIHAKRGRKPSRSRCPPDQSPAVAASWPAQSCRERLDGLVYSVTFLFVRSDGLRLPDAW